MDSHATDHPYPEHLILLQQKYSITGVGATTITMNVGISSTLAHLFKSASAGAVNLKRIAGGRSNICTRCYYNW